MQEPTNFHAWILFLQPSRQKHEVVVMAPDRITGLIGVQNDSCKKLVRFLVSSPLQSHVLCLAELRLESDRDIVK